jgi:hypothetical protein
MTFTQNQPVVPVEQAQAATKQIANSPTLEGFQQWLLESHGYASFMLCTTTGAEFSRHAAALDHFGIALATVQQFVRLNRG